MKRRLTALILLTFLIGTCTACGAKSEDIAFSVDVFETQTASDNIETSKASSNIKTPSKSSSKKEATSKIPTDTSEIYFPKTEITPQTATSNLTSPSAKKPQTLSFTSKKNIEQVKTTGRVVFESAYGLSMYWTGSAIEMNLTCVGDIIIRLDCKQNSNARLKIYLDGKLYSEDVTTLTQTTDLTVATGLEEGIYNLKIVRSDDCEEGRISLTYVQITGTLAQKPEDKKLYIKAFGGSQLMGLGNLLSDEWFKTSYTPDEARDRKNQDGTLTYPMVAADVLNADISIVARQGAGVALTRHLDEKQGLLEMLYSITAPSLSAAYTPTREADIILIDDGEIDITPGLYAKNELNYVQATERAVSFLNKLRTDHPNAGIIWCYGIDHNCERKLLPEGNSGMAISSEGFVNDIIARMGGQAKGFYSLKMEYNPTRKGYPSVSEHNAAGIKVAEKIREILR